jgi:hypothetical protein
LKSKEKRQGRPLPVEPVAQVAEIRKTDGEATVEDARWVLEEAKADAEQIAHQVQRLERRVDVALRLLAEAKPAAEDEDDPMAQLESGARFNRANGEEGDGMRGGHRVAVQMALAGRSRDEVGERLVEISLGGEDVESVLDEVFGDGQPG